MKIAADGDWQGPQYAGLKNLASRQRRTSTQVGDLCTTELVQSRPSTAGPGRTEESRWTFLQRLHFWASGTWVEPPPVVVVEEASSMAVPAQRQLREPHDAAVAPDGGSTAEQQKPAGQAA